MQIRQTDPCYASYAVLEAKVKNSYTESMEGTKAAQDAIKKWTKRGKKAVIEEKRKRNDQQQNRINAASVRTGAEGPYNRTM